MFNMNYLNPQKVCPLFAPINEWCCPDPTISEVLSSMVLLYWNFWTRGMSRSVKTAQFVFIFIIEEINKWLNSTATLTCDLKNKKPHVNETITGKNFPYCSNSLSILWSKRCHAASAKPNGFFWDAMSLHRIMASVSLDKWTICVPDSPLSINGRSAALSHCPSISNIGPSIKVVPC